MTESGFKFSLTEPSPHRKICVFFRTLHFAELIYRRQKTHAHTHTHTRCVFKYSLRSHTNSCTGSHKNSQERPAATEHWHLYAVITRHLRQRAVGLHPSGGLPLQATHIVRKGWKSHFTRRSAPSVPIYNLLYGRCPNHFRHTCAAASFTRAMTPALR